MANIDDILNSPVPEKKRSQGDAAGASAEARNSTAARIQYMGSHLRA
jgi:hypothetical protein